MSLAEALGGGAFGCSPQVGCVFHSVSPGSLAWGWARLLFLRVILTWPRAARAGPAAARGLLVRGTRPAFRLLPSALWVGRADTLAALSPAEGRWEEGSL